MNSIYESGLGDNLIIPDNYNNEIIAYLKSEAKIINRLISNYDTIIEVGCMHGRLLKDVLEKSKRYFGIDNSKTYIEKGRFMHLNYLNNNVQLVNANCEELDKLIQIKGFRSSNKAVLIYPFNSFGNIQFVEKAIRAITIIDIPFIIFTYRCNRQTTSIRLNYYIKSGFNLPIIKESDKSVQILDQFGLNSHAYKERWLKKEFAKYKVMLYAKNFSIIGKLFSNSIY